MVEVTRFLNIPVYTMKGTFVGNVKNVILDVTSKRLDALLVGKTNPALVEGGSDVAIPYRWVRSFDDICVLGHFPQHVDIPAAATGDEETTVLEDIEEEGLEAVETVQ